MKFPIAETIVTAICLAILLGLGTWQVQRLHWKNDLIARLQTQYDAPETQALTPEKLASLTQEDMPMAYGAVNGHWLRDKAILLGPRTEDGRMGYHLLVPLALDNDHVLIVNGGWVPDMWKDTLQERLAILPAETVTVRGILRKPDWSSFASQNSPGNDLWFRADIDQIAGAKGITNAYPFLLYADSIEPPLHDVIAQETHWLPRNKHLQYAIFWYAMAAVMLGVYGFYVKSKNKIS